MDKEITQAGLTTEQARRLLEQYGPNEIAEKKPPSVFKVLFSQLNNFLTLLLILAGVVSFIVGERLDGVFIFLIVLLNAFFGFYQEYKAEKALLALKKLTVTLVRVFRDGREQEIDSRNLVAGDVFYLEAGAKVPADAQILRSWHLEVNEAPLTGESFPVEKNAHQSEKRDIFLGTVVVKGRCYAQVVKTGERTRFGQLAKTLAQIREEKTPLQRKLEIFSKQLGIIGLIASFAVFGLSFIQEKSVIESFVFAVSLAVAAVPEGLPAVMTITLAIGVERMAKRKAIVRKLDAVEALGAVTLIATDKTGTLTTNQMRVKKIWVKGEIYHANDLPHLAHDSFGKLVLNGVLCSTASVVFKVDHGDFDVVGDPTEGAILLLGQKAGLVPDQVRGEWKMTDELQFNPDTKRMTVVVKKGKETKAFSKGAPESILAICTLTEPERTAILQESAKFAREGLRIIAFSYKEEPERELEKDQIFLGFVGIADPIRPEVKDAVAVAHRAEIKVVMITGDNELTAEAIGLEAGIIGQGEDILTGKQLDDFSDEELLTILPKVRIFARTTPDHKYRLVKLFQRQGEIVAVTGDGVNDALALKQADVGVAMGLTGTDVAKETADMIITDDNFATLVAAVEQGRNIICNIKNAIKYLLACNISEVMYILLAVALKLPVPTALQILYINLVTDGLPAISFAFSPRSDGVMRQPPRKIKSILDVSDFKHLLSLGALMVVLFLVSTLGVSITVLFTTVILIQHFALIDFWLSHKLIIKQFHLLRHPVFLLAFFGPIATHPLLLYNPTLNRVFGTTPLNPSQLIYSVAISLGYLLLVEGIKITKSHSGKSSIS